MALSQCATETDTQGRELTVHGCAPFPVACYHDDLAQAAVPWHWHDELEAILVSEGRAVIAAGTEKYVIDAGAGIFINTGVLHSVWEAAAARTSAGDCASVGSDGTDIEAGSCRLHSIVFHPRLIGGDIDSVFWQNYLRPLLSDASRPAVVFSGSGDWHKKALESIEAGWQACAAELPGYEFQVREALSRLIYLLAGHYPSGQKQPSEKALRDAQRMKAMLQFIHRSYGQELNTELIARSAAISASECLRCFHGTIGVTPIQYVKQFRVQKAAALLASTSQRISAIGQDCGFQEMSYFAKTFKAFCGCTPSEYRRRKQAEAESGRAASQAAGENAGKAGIRDE